MKISIFPAIFSVTKFSFHFLRIRHAVDPEYVGTGCILLHLPGVRQDQVIAMEISGTDR